MASLCVLVVDDISFNQKALRMQLTPLINAPVSLDSLLPPLEDKASDVHTLQVDSSQQCQPLLCKFACKFEFASDGAQACDMIEQRSARGDAPYDQVWMDLQMPVLDGLGAIRRIRAFEKQLLQQKPWAARVHIVAITANNHADDERAALEAGADCFVQKPAAPSRLRALVEPHKSRAAAAAARASVSASANAALCNADQK
jgi:CheY-like chemotaxis protein